MCVCVLCELVPAKYQLTKYTHTYYIYPYTTLETEEAVTPSTSGLRADYHPAQVPASRSRVLSSSWIGYTCDWHISGDVRRGSVTDSVARVAETPR